MTLLFWRAMVLRSAAKRQNPTAPRAPRVSILKPLAGSDDELEDNLESFARIDYPSYEILFGVADLRAPAFAVARRFCARNPRIDARIIVTDPGAATNPKVAQLVALERVATGELFVISDSNIRVGSRYLWSLVSELSDPRVGIVTSLFAGTGERTLGAALENLQICASTAPGIAAVDAVCTRPLTVGKSMALRKRDLVRLGGFVPVGHVLAEDHLLGRRILDAGYVARTSFDVVENRNVGCSLSGTVERHTRWAKMRRSLNPVGFFMEPLLSPIAIASAGVLLAPGKATADFLGIVAVVQTLWALLAVRLVRGNGFAWWYAPLELVRSYVALFCWLRAWVSRRIAWRGHPFLLQRGRGIVPVVSVDDRVSAGARSPACAGHRSGL